MKRQRNQNIFNRIIVLMGTVLCTGLFFAPIPVQADGTCVAVRDSEGNLHPCDWSPPQQNYNNTYYNQEIQREREQERQRRERERMKEHELENAQSQQQQEINQYNSNQLKNHTSLLKERERAALQKQKALIRKQKKKEALKQLQVAHHQGENAKNSNKEPSAAESEIGFDKPGSSGKGSGVIDLSHLSWKMKVPRKIARDPHYRKLDHQMTALIHKHRLIQSKLRKVEHLMRQATDTEQKGKLQMEVVHLKRANARIASQAAMVHKKEVDFVHYHMNLTAGGSP